MCGSMADMLASTRVQERPFSGLMLAHLGLALRADPWDSNWRA